ncbi:MAG TPA: hypothetical protein VKY37_03135 [Brumimicrobium sp.]|nr:hypothetical protein [Brumimicrobium sp.]
MRTLTLGRSGWLSLSQSKICAVEVSGKLFYFPVTTANPKDLESEIGF